MKEPPNLARLQDQVLKLIKEAQETRRKNKMSYKLLEAINAVNYKDLATRALWTFLQAFLAVFLFTAEPILDLLFKGDWTGLYALLITTAISAAAAGFSALKTIIVSVIKELKLKAE